MQFWNDTVKLPFTDSLNFNVRTLLQAQNVILKLLTNDILNISVSTCVRVKNDTVKLSTIDSQYFLAISTFLHWNYLLLLRYQDAAEHTSAAQLARTFARTKTFSKLRKRVCKTMGLTYHT